MSANPVVLSMLDCDHIWRDPSTGKWDLLGVFGWLPRDVEPLKEAALEVCLLLFDPDAILRGVCILANACHQPGDLHSGLPTCNAKAGVL